MYWDEDLHSVATPPALGADDSPSQLRAALHVRGSSTRGSHAELTKRLSGILASEAASAAAKAPEEELTLFEAETDVRNWVEAEERAEIDRLKAESRRLNEQQASEQNIKAATRKRLGHALVKAHRDCVLQKTASEMSPEVAAAEGDKGEGADHGEGTKEWL